MITTCPICGNNKKHYNEKPNSPSLWSKTCGNRSCVKILTQTTNIQEYGHISPLHSIEENGKSLLQNSVKQRYNVENISQLEHVKQKKKSTCLANFGVEWPMQSDEVKTKSRTTLVNKYGYDNISKVPEIIQQIKQTQIQKYGMFFMQTEEGKNKLIEQTREKHGVDWYFSSDKFKLKLEQRCLELFGVTNPFFSPEVQASIAKRNGYGKSKEETNWLDKLGVPSEYRQHNIRSISGKNYIVDGFDPETNTVYEYNGSFWHGNPAYYDGNKDHPVVKGQTYGDLYERTIKKQEDILNSGYNLIVEWSKA